MIKYIKNIFKQPKLFYILFFLELMERFSFYCIQSIMIIYLIDKIGLSEKNAINIFSSFTATLYGLIVIGGYISNKIIGNKKALITGLITLLIGYIILFFSNHKLYYIYLSLSTIAIGYSIYKPNPSYMLSEIYKKNKKNTDSAYTLYYMSTNIGSFISIIISPLICSKYGWKTAFLLPIIGIIIASYIYYKFKKYIKTSKNKKNSKKKIKNKNYLITYIILSLILITNYIIKKQNLINILFNIIIIIIITMFFIKIFCLKNKEKKNTIASIILIFEAIIFFIIYNLMPTTLNFFTIKNIKNNIMGVNIKPLQFQALNPFWIIIFSPILAFFHKKTGNKIKTSYKFVIGMLLCSISFFILAFGLHLNKERTGIISSNWLILSYMFQSIGELMISGLGLSMITQLVPKSILSLTTTTWFLTTSISSIIAGKISNANSLSNNLNLNPLKSSYIYYNSFIKIGSYCLLTSIFMLIIAPILNTIISKNK